MYFICLLYVNVESTLFIALVQLIIPTIRHYNNNNIVKILSKLCMWLSLIRSLDGEVLGLTAVGCQIFTTETRRYLPSPTLLSILGDLVASTYF